jgi:methylthioribulose-1-phosphate dehydratase
MNFKNTSKKNYFKDASYFFLSNFEKIQLKKICDLAKFLDNMHAIPATSSNFSLKLSTHSFLISKSGIHKRNLNPSLFVRVDISGNPLTPLSPKPSDETFLHSFIYKNFPQANVVAHCHAREFESLEYPIHNFPGHELLKAFGFKNHEQNFQLPVYKNSQDMNEIYKILEHDHKTNKNISIGFMLEKHGLYCFGNSVEQVQNYLEVLFHFLS